MEPLLYDNLIRHNVTIFVADPQYRAAVRAPGAASAAVNMEQCQYQAPSTAPAAVTAKQQQ